MVVASDGKKYGCNIGVSWKHVDKYTVMDAKRCLGKIVYGMKWRRGGKELKDGMFLRDGVSLMRFGRDLNKTLEFRCIRSTDLFWKVLGHTDSHN